MKAIALGIVAILIIAGGLVAVEAGNGNGKGNGANEIDLNGFHYTLNILGKKSDWKGGGRYNNPDRSTIFVPEDTTNFHYHLTLPDGSESEPYDDIAIEFRKGTEDFKVMDGNAFDDGWCSIELPDKKFSVWIASRAKPGFSTEIDGMVYIEDTKGGWYLYCIGELTVTRKWKDAYDLFWVSTGEDPWGAIGGDTWIFDYLDILEGFQIDEDLWLTNGMYFWDFDNNGNKLIKVRFYPI